MTVRRVVFVTVVIIAALPMLAIVVLLVELSYQPAYDRSDSNYQRYSEAFDRLRVQLDRYGTTKDDVIDLSQLNNGAWKVACVFSGYTNPLEEMRALDANISEKDQLRLTEAGSRGFRLGQVEEFEMMIAYVDLSNNAQFVHFASGFGPEGQHFQKCISRPETRLFLATP